jgi:hypothetical protein
MARTMPSFVKGEAINAVAEYKQFAETVGDPAAHLLAELVHMHNEGSASDVPPADKNSTKVRGLNCRSIEGWVIFYTAQSVENRFQVTILHVGNLALNSFGSLESEAEKRQRTL